MLHLWVEVEIVSLYPVYCRYVALVKVMYWFFWSCITLKRQPIHHVTKTLLWHTYLKHMDVFVQHYTSGGKSSLVWPCIMASLVSRNLNTVTRYMFPFHVLRVNLDQTGLNKTHCSPHIYGAPAMFSSSISNKKFNNISLFGSWCFLSKLQVALNFYFQLTLSLWVLNTDLSVSLFNYC